MLIDENRWRAQRYGVDQGLVDFGRHEIVPYGELLDELIALVSEDAAHFGCQREVAHAKEILARGTSAHAQRRTYAASLAAGATKPEALQAVVRWLIEATQQGL
jgi:glutamate---cysteine ligase / carboxylate-amine ligase